MKKSRKNAEKSWEITKKLRLIRQRKKPDGYTAVAKRLGRKLK